MRRAFAVVVRVCVLAPLLAVAPVAAQPADLGGTRRVSFDTVVGVQDILLEDNPWRTQVIIDSAATLDIGGGLHANVRPVFWRVDGQWQALLDQASLRYEAGREVRIRIEAGRFPSPIGLGMTENRANVNPGVLWCHRLYYSPLPALGPGIPPQSLVSAVYPMGVMATLTASVWDVRAAALDRAPVDDWRATARRTTPTHAVIGGGVTPRQGLRLGVAGAWGALRDSASDRSRYQMINAEVDWAFAYTRISGEWTRDRFDTSLGRRSADGWTVQARQTLGPRWFAHSRATRATAPQVAADGAATPRTYLAVDSTLGYLVSPEITARVGHTALRGWRAPTTDHQIGISVVWARRWW